MPNQEKLSWFATVGGTPCPSDSRYGRVLITFSTEEPEEPVVSGSTEALMIFCPNGDADRQMNGVLPGREVDDDGNTTAIIAYHRASYESSTSDSLATSKKCGALAAIQSVQVRFDELFCGDCPANSSNDDGQCPGAAALYEAEMSQIDPDGWEDPLPKFVINTHMIKEIARAARKRHLADNVT